MPRIAFIAGNADAGVDLWTCGMEPSATRPTLAHGSLGEPEDLLVCGRAVGRRCLVRLLDNLEIAALLAWAVEDDAEPTAIALQGDDWYALDLGANGDVLPDPNLAQAEDVLVAPWPAILDEKRHHGL